jgi:hypothetical protein
MRIATSEQDLPIIATATVNGHDPSMPGNQRNADRFIEAMGRDVQVMVVRPLPSGKRVVGKLLSCDLARDLGRADLDLSAVWRDHDDR